MAGTINFKCPGCGAYLEFDPQRQRFVCAYCGADYDEQTLIRESERREEETEKETAAEASPDTGSLRSYHCQNCGAEIVTDETTAATRCYFCHNPVVISDRVSEAYRPDGVIPFGIDREDAGGRFDEYIRRHRFVDRKFFSGAQLEIFSGVYYPYWIGQIEGDGSFSGEGKTVHTQTAGDYLVTTTNYYRLEREGQLVFSDLIRKALNKADRQLSDGIHPYDQSEMKPFASGYLSGFLAERRDVEEAEAREDMLSETQGYVKDLLTQDSGLAGLTGDTRFEPTRTKLRYALLPAWVLTWRNGHSDRVYYYMMNGQNGKVCGKLPVNLPKLLATCAVLGAAVFGLMCAGGAFLW